MNPDKGTAQTSIVLASNASASAQTYYFTRFVSGELKGAQTISSGNWNYAFAAQENNANANFPVAAASTAVPINVYVWRPSTGTKVGTILDGNTAASYAEASTTETSMFGTFTGASVTAADKDVIICEIWFTTTQGTAASRNDTFYFDGSVETNNQGTTTVTNHASYIETSQTLAFYLVKALTETITFSDFASCSIVPGTPQNNVSGKKGTITLDATSGAHDQSFTGVGFQPKALIIWGTGSTNESFNEGIVHSFGMSDGTTHGAVGGGQVDASATNAHMIRNDAIIEQVSATTPSTVVVRASVKTFDSDGFTLTYASKTDTTQYVYHYIAIGGSDISNVKVKHETAGTTATGNASYTGTGFKPDAMIFANAFPADTVNTNATGFQLNVGFGTGTSQFSVAQGRDTGSGCECQFNDNRVLFGQTSPFQNVKLNSALVSLDSNGYTLNHTIAPTTGLPWFYLAIKGGYWACGVFSQKTSTGTLATTFRYATTPVVLFIGAINSATADSNQTGSPSTSIGAADSALNQGCTAIGNDGVGNNFPVKVSLTSAVTRSFTPAATATSSTINAEADINDMSTNAQFTLDWTTANATARKLGYLLLTKTIATGQNITKSLTETVSISESLARTNAKTRSQTETINLTTGTTLARTAKKTRSNTETINLTTGTSLARTASKRRSNTETITISETPARTASKRRSLTETITISDSTVKLKSRFRTLTDTITISDSVTKLKSRFRTLTETISLTGTVARTKASLKSISQSITITDSLTRKAAKTRAISESVTISDSLARQAAKIRTITQTITFSDSVTRLRTATRSITESLAIADSVTQSVGHGAKQISKSLTETIAITDSLARTANKIRAATEIITISDSLTRTANKTRAISQTISITDAVARARGILKSLTQTISISDSLARTANKARSNSQTITISDSLSRAAAKTRALPTQTITFSDSVTQHLTHGAKEITVFLSETITIGDSLARTANKIRNLAETITLSSVLTKSAAKNRALPAQSISFNDSVSQAKTTFHAVIRSLTESISLSDSLTKTAAKVRALAPESLTITDIVIKTKAKIRQLPAETLTISDNLARKTAKLRNLLERIAINDILEVYKNGIRLVAPQPPNKGGQGPLQKVKMPRLKQILYPVYTTTELRRIERRRKLRLYEPLAVIPAFEQNIHHTIAPFVVINPAKNTVEVKFVVSDAKIETKTTIVLDIEKQTIPITAATSKQKAQANFTMSETGIKRWTAANTSKLSKLSKLAKIMKIWKAATETKDIT